MLLHLTSETKKGTIFSTRMLAELIVKFCKKYTANVLIAITELSSLFVVYMNALSTSGIAHEEGLSVEDKSHK